ncbi:hypothetical protein AAGS40_24240 [Paraburkholderia sp. PREW-6R]|uniref:hypothetical protein n=1 Tax=Paraburkholderia sp. PREW-6R TaxID=3141544 RepID=UPI0031F4A7C8
MVEFLVSMTMVMSVLLLAIVMLAKFNDMRNRTLMGSRYLAWERTVWSDGDTAKNLASDPATPEGWSSTYGTSALTVAKRDAELKGEIMQRLLAANNSAISSADRLQNKLAALQPVMWHDYGGNPLLTSSSDVAVSTALTADPASSQSSIALSQWSVPTATGGQYAARLSLPSSTLRSGTLSLTVGATSDVLERLWPKDGKLPAFAGLTFSDTNTLLTNTWVPDGSASNKALFSEAVPAAHVALVPTSEYQGLKKYAPEISTLEFGRVQQDVVPATRLNQ